MKIVSTVCKTTYTVHINFMEWWEVFQEDYKTREQAREQFRGYPNNMKKIDQCTMLRRMAKAFGFYGGENIGFYNRLEDCITCQFFNVEETK